MLEPGQMALSFQDAVQTLKGMFGDFDDETLGMVLQSNGGHMERTVDVLLGMGAQMGGGETESSSTALQQAPPADSLQPPAPRAKHVALPDDFLRVTNPAFVWRLIIRVLPPGSRVCRFGSCSWHGTNAARRDAGKNASGRDVHESAAAAPGVPFFLW